jgi:epsilon-lactone hydrolase
MTARRAPRGPRLPPALLRQAVRQIGRRCLNPALPWPVQRTRLDQATGNTPLPRGTVREQRVIAGLPAEVITAAEATVAASAGSRTVVHFHGGGYCVGSPRTAGPWAARLSAQTGCQVIQPQYRLAPEHPYPAALEDARAILRELSAESSRAEFNRAASGPATLVVSGDSAGGGLALAALTTMRDDGEPLPAGIILLSPWLDLGRDRRAVPDLVRKDVLLSPEWLDACARAYADPSAWSDPLVSPLHATLAGLPPLLIQAGTAELLAPDAELLAARASSAGVDVTYTRWPRMWHDFTLQPGLLAAADSALAQAAWFITQAR